MEWLKLDNRVRFHILCSGYTLITIILFIMTYGDFPLSGFPPLRVGLVIGAFFPFLALFYYYTQFIEVATESQKYISGDKKAADKGKKRYDSLPSLLKWIIPSIFIHVIISFSLLIILGPLSLYYPDNANSEEPVIEHNVYTSFYQYGKIFKNFQRLEARAQENIHSINYYPDLTIEKMKQLSNYYTPYLGRYIQMDLTVQTLEAYSDPGSKLPEDSFIHIKRLSDISLKVNQIPFLIAVAFGFLGALIFCLRDVVTRYNTGDLYPKTYVFYNIRFIVSITLSITVAYYALDKWPAAFAALIFFLIGYFPDRVITFFNDRMNHYLRVKTVKYQSLPLSMIQGVTNYKVFRLREIGIADAQNLAIANIKYLKDNLPFREKLICDWIAQSMLFIHFPDKIENLRKNGIRTILDFNQCLKGSTEEQIKEFSTKTDIPKIQLDSVRNILGLEHMKGRIKQLKEYSKIDENYTEESYSMEPIYS